MKTTEHKQFKPFEKVLVQNIQGVWMIDFYSNWNEKWQGHQTFKVNGDYAQSDDGILPYEGNEHLVGKVNEPVEEVKLEEGEWVIGANEVTSLLQGVGTTGRYDKIVSEGILKQGSDGIPYKYSYAIRFSDFNPNDMEETRKHILCVKNGKVVRYKE